MTQKELYQQEIEKITRIIRDKYQPEKIILYGSAARGDLHQDSDIDMLIIKDSDKPRRQRIRDISRLFIDDMYRVPFSPFVLTRAEFDKGKQEGRYIIRQILKDGKVLYEA